MIILGIGREKRAFNYSPNTQTYREKLGKDSSLIKVLDPFAGAGNLIFEAKRLGLDCVAQDYNPVSLSTQQIGTGIRSEVQGRDWLKI